MYMSAKSKVPSSGRMYLAGDGVDVFLHVGEELALCGLLLLFGRVSTTRLKFSSGNLASTGTRLLAEPDDRVHCLAALEPVLQREVGGREDLGQEVAQEQFAEAAAQLGRAQDLLQARDVLAHVEDLLGGLVQAAQALAHFLDDLGRVVEPGVQVSRGLLELLRDLPELRIHLGGDLAELGVHLLGHLSELAVHLHRHLAQLLVHGLLAPLHGLGQLAAQGLHLLLEQATPGSPSSSASGEQARGG